MVQYVQYYMASVGVKLNEGSYEEKNSINFLVSWKLNNWSKFVVVYFIFLIGVFVVVNIVFMHTLCIFYSTLFLYMHIICIFYA